MPGPWAVTLPDGTVVYDPFEKQVRFHTSAAKYRLFGGSRGCGKSMCLRWDNYFFCLAVPNARTLVVRRHLEELRRSHLRFIARDMQALGGEAAGLRWKPSDVGAGVLHFPNGSLIEFGHVQHEDDVEQYLSAEYDRLTMDELVTFTEYQHLMLCTSLRTTKPGVTPLFGAATNPGGAQAQWVKRRWIDKDLTPDEDEAYDPADYEYIPALPSDNPHLNWEEYHRELSRLPPELRRAYRDGDWDIFVGQFFPEFRRQVHVLTEEEAETTYRLGPAFERGAALDWGYGHEGVCLWCVLHPDGSLVVEDEYVFNGPRRDKYVAAEVAEHVLARTRERGWRVTKWLGDPKMDDQTGHETGETLMETFRRKGVPLQKADNDRPNGWARVRAWLRVNPLTGKPFLRVHPRCVYLIRTFGAVMMREDRPEDIDTEGPDHAVDALRYYVMGRPAPVGERPSVAYPPGTVGYLRRLAERESSSSYVLGSRNVRRRSHGRL